MTKLCLFFALLLPASILSAQFYDNFSDNDYIHSPPWVASPSDFIINTFGQLQSSSNTPNNTFQIYTTNELAVNTQWEFWVRLDFNTSSANYVDIWLISSESNLNSDSNEGYFVRLGTTNDNVSLFKKRTSGSAISIITGLAGTLNRSSSTLKIKVIRTPSDRWILLRDFSGTGKSYRSEGEITSNEINSSNYFGISIRQSTASFFGKHFFDDFEVKESESAPTTLNVQSIEAFSSNTVQVVFSHPVNITTAEESFHYHINTLGSPVAAMVEALDGKVVTLTFENNIEPNVLNTILIDGVSDIYGNTITGATGSFTFFKAQRFDVVINEVFADPAPQIGLPGQKFIELRNNASAAVNLGGWQLVSGSGTAILPSVNIQPDNFLIITSASGLNEYSHYGITVAVTNFPGLNIGGSELVLQDAEGNTIHAMRYDLTTYRNIVKQGGGFSLELINPFNGCTLEGNWTASNDLSGGTPGKENSVLNKNTERSNLAVTGAYLSHPDTLKITLNRPVDSIVASFPANYNITPELFPKNVELLAPYFDKVKIGLGAMANSGKIYTVVVNGLSDCIGNTLGTNNTASFGLFQEPEKRDIVINEILSNPKTTDGEYVELYNNSQNVFDVSRLYLSNRNSGGEIASVTPISSEPGSFLPESFLLLTKSKSIVASDYPLANADAIHQMSSMPSYPNDNGFVLLVSQQGEIIDEVDYDKAWHFQLIKDRKGVSLERIDYNSPSIAGNFHSAAGEAGYGTPGYKNSQNSASNAVTDLEFSIVPEVFSPDNDGIDDFLTINYSFRTPGFITNIKIFDASGRLVRHLEKNSISGTKGYYRWDGLDDKNQKLPQGIYLIYFESFNEDGQNVRHKKVVTLVRRF